jgi:uncharacterized protein YycO
MIVLYKGKSALSRAIRWWTRAPYSHAAWEREGGNLIEAWTHGVRMVASYNTDHTPGTEVEWYEVEAMREHKDAVERFLMAQLGKKYDFKAVFGFVWHKDSNDPDRWMCSELIAEAFRQAHAPLLLRAPSFKVSPAILAYSPKLPLVKTGTC